MPAGILQPPLYDPNVPNYLNMASNGFFIAHEITHGYDSVGRRYDKNGIFYEDGDGLWTNQTIESFSNRSECFIDQYGKYTVRDLNIPVDSVFTLAENIADNGALKTDFRAYREWIKRNGEELILPGMEDYNQEQLFFIAFAQTWCFKFKKEYLAFYINYDTHAPPEYRVLGTTSNFEEFSQVFNCPLGSTQNPTNKCKIW